MNRLPSEFFSTPPSPRTPSVTRMPFTLGGQTIPVGWNWMNSMLISVGAGPQRQGVAVAGVLPRVRRHLERLADAAGGEHDGRRLEQDEAAGLAPVAERAGDPVAVLDQLGDRALVEDLDAGLVVAEFGVVLLLQRDDLLLHGADDLQAGAVADVREPRVGVPAEVALADPAVLGAVEQRAVGLQLPHPVGRLLACSSAIRQLFRNLPPRMVSRKCTCQESFALTLPIAAAQPPSAITVCALPNNDLDTTATRGRARGPRSPRAVPPRRHRSRPRRTGAVRPRS